MRSPSPLPATPEQRGYQPSSSPRFVHKVNHDLVALAVRKIRERRMAEVTVEVRAS